jgi:hypothetical protein
MEWIEPDHGDAFARSVGAALIAESVLLLASRIFTLVYSVANEVNVPDKHRTPTSTLALYLLFSIVPFVALAWAGGQLRRTPAGAWREASWPGRVALALAGVVNVALGTWAGMHLASSGPAGKEGLVAWLLTIVVALLVVVGLVRDAAGRARPTVER